MIPAQRNEKAQGFDGIPPDVIKEKEIIVPKNILGALNDLLKKQEFSSSWKVAKLILIPKGKLADSLSNYIPIYVKQAV